jgi:HSP20 family protein
MANLVPGKKRQSAGEPPVERDWQPVARLRNDVENLMERYLSQWQRLADELLGFGRGWGVDVLDEEGTVIIRAEAPGFEAEDFDVQVRGNELVLTAERADDSVVEGHALRRRGRFERIIPLPEQADVNKVQARYHSGVLAIRIPKGKEAQRKKIAVKKG